MTRLTLRLLLAYACAACAATESPRDEKIVAALAKAEKAAAAEQWSEALAAGNRLRTLCRERSGEEDPDTALAELFLGEVRDHLGERTLAEAHFRRALGIQEKVLRSDAPELATTRTRLAAWLKGERRYDEAAGLLRRVLEVQVKTHGADELETAQASTNLARILRLKGDHAGAAPLLERALAIQRRALGGTDPETIAGLRELAQVHELAGELAAAELDLAERVVAVEAHFGATSPELVAALSEWGRLAERQEHFADAEPRYRRALSLLPSDAPALAAPLAQLGWCLRNLGRYDEARPLLQRALDARLRTLGPGHVETAASYRQLGWVLRLQRDLDSARVLFEKALAVREQLLGEADPLTIESLGELGDLHWLRGAFDEAANLLETRRYRIESASGPASEATGAAWHGLAIVYESAKRWPEATQAALRSLTLIEQRLGPADPQAQGELLLLSRICAAAGAFAPALTQYARLAAWFRQHPEANGASRAELLRQFAIASLRAGKTEAAAPLFRESRRAHEVAFGPADPATLRSIGDLWTFYDETRQPALALEVARDLAARSETALGAEAPATVEVWDRVAQLCLTLGDRAEAMKWFRRALDGRRGHSGDGSTELLDALARTAAQFEEVRDFARAAVLRTERLAALGRKFGPGSAETAAACGELALCYFRQRDLAAARGMFEQQLVLLEKSAGPGSVEALTVIARIGDVAVAARDWPWAMRERERLAEGCAQRFGTQHLEHGRALLLLGEALLGSGADARSEAVLRNAHRLVAAQSGLASRAACALARATLRRGDEVEAKRWTRTALAGSFDADEALAEAFSALGEAWARAGDEPSSESVLTAALTILTPTAGEHDEHTLALLERLATLRLRLGRAGAAPLLERALAASEALNGREAEPTAEVLGWLALARVQEKQFHSAHAAAQRMLAIVGAGEDARRFTALARELEAWTRWWVEPDAGRDATAVRLAGLLLERWGWLEPLSPAIASAFAEARAVWSTDHPHAASGPVPR